jgi:preprotein translocase subunit Sec61beta
MIARIESNCTTGEIKYFDENEVEIDPSSISIEPIPIIEPIPADEPSEG